MNLFQTPTTPVNNGERRMYFIPCDDQFLIVSKLNDQLVAVDIVKSNELSTSIGDCHYIDVDNSFNLLPKLSDEMINEQVLIDFLNWDVNKKVYHFQDAKHNITIHFQTNTINDLLINKTTPSTFKHHISEFLLSIAEYNGVYALYFNGSIFIAAKANEELLLCNCFTAKTDEEVLYYLLLIYQEKDLSHEEMPLVFYGCFPQQPEMTLTYLSKYIRKVKLEQFVQITPDYQGIVQLVKKQLCE